MFPERGILILIIILHGERVSSPSLSSMAPMLACKALPGIEVTMGYEKDESSRWGNWPHTSMVQAVKGMGARHTVREPYISFEPKLLKETLNLNLNLNVLDRP